MRTIPMNAGSLDQTRQQDFPLSSSYVHCMFAIRIKSDYKKKQVKIKLQYRSTNKLNDKSTFLKKFLNSYYNFELSKLALLFCLKY